MTFKRLLLAVAVVLWAVVNLFLVHLLIISLRARNNEYANCVENPFVHTIDLFDEDFQEISKREGIVEDLSEINQRFHAAQTFDFFEATRSTFYFRKEGYRGSSQLLLETGPHTNPEVVALKGMLLGPGMKEHFDLSVAEGSYFSETDYMLPTQSNRISVILGDAFKAYYQLGDSIDLLVRGEVRVGSVIGFLRKGSSILWFNERAVLDEYVLYPEEAFSDFPKNQAEHRYMFRALLSRNNGLVLPKQDIGQVQQEINDICAQVNLLAYALSMTYKERLQFADKEYYRQLCFLVGFNLLLFYGTFVILRRRKRMLHSNGVCDTQ